MLAIETNGDVLPKKSLKDSVFDYLHARIVAGKVAPGEWLRQEDISTALGVSQTPVREALDLLVSVGLAERVPYRGVRVPEMDAHEIVDAYILRLILESAAIRLAALNISQAELAHLQSLLESTRRLTRLDDMSSLQQINRRFHNDLAEASHNRLLSKHHQTAANKFPDWRLYEYMFRHPELLETSLPREYAEHQAILDALAARAPEQAVRAVTNHIHQLAQELVVFLNIPADLLAEKEAQVQALL
jgi:DNA-binding GntR family transcriptional regulator